MVEIVGDTTNAGGSAVFGFNGARQQIPGTTGRPEGNGVWGHTTAKGGSGVVGSVEPGLGVETAGVTGIGQTAGRFFGRVEVKGTLLAGIWRYFHDFRASGIFNQRVGIAEPGVLNFDSAVMVSLTELSNGLPHIGDAAMTVYNVSVINLGLLHIRGQIYWPNDLHIRATLLIASGPFIPMAQAAE